MKSFNKDIELESLMNKGSLVFEPSNYSGMFIMVANRYGVLDCYPMTKKQIYKKYKNNTVEFRPVC